MRDRAADTIREVKLDGDAGVGAVYVWVLVLAGANSTGYVERRIGVSAGSHGFWLWEAVG